MKICFKFYIHCPNVKNYTYKRKQVIRMGRDEFWLCSIKLIES